MEQHRALDALSAMAHDTRLTLLRMLVAAGPGGLAAGEAAVRLGLAAPRLSFHLSILSSAGLVRARRSGRNIHYSADTAAIGAVLGYVIADCCAGHPEVTACCATAGEAARRA
jgi:DNA-binding transcriptional ArsR family regulator